MRRDGGDQAIDERAEAGAEGGEDRRGSRFEVRGSRQCGDEGAVFALHLDEGGQDGADAEGADVAAEDSAEERGGDAVEHFAAEVAEGEVGDGFVVRAGWRRGVRRRGRVRRGRRRWRAAVKSGEPSSAAEVRGDHHVEAVGHGDEAAGGILRGGEEDVGLARGVVGGDEFGLEAEFDGEFAGPGFGGDPAIGAGFDGEAAFADGFDEAAEAVGGFKQDGFDWCAVAGEAREFVGGGEAGDASSDDGDAFHRCSGCEVRGSRLRRLPGLRRAAGESLRDSGR